MMMQLNELISVLFYSFLFYIYWMHHPLIGEIKLVNDIEVIEKQILNPQCSPQV